MIYRAWRRPGRFFICCARVAAVAALGSAAGLLGACSNAPVEQAGGGQVRATVLQPDSATVATAEACALLTAAEVGELTGRAVRPLSQGPACVFVADGSGASPEAVVQVSFRPAAAFRVVQLGNSMKRHEIVAVPELGPEAYYDDAHGDLYVRLPGRTLVIGMPLRIREHPRHRLAPQLGQLALARLLAAPAPTTVPNGAQ